MNEQQFEACIEACNACAAACDLCAVSCLQEHDVKTMARCVALAMDCAEMCRVAAAFMARGSDLASAICRACAEVCEACGDECGKHTMRHCKACAEACLRGADECHRVAGAGAMARPEGKVPMVTS